MRCNSLKIISFCTLFAIPATSLAYSFHTFVGNATEIKEEEAVFEEELSEEDLEQQYDTQCRKELGLEGAEALGAIGYNIQRCINNKRRAKAYEERLARRENRVQSSASRILSIGQELNRRTASFRARIMKQYVESKITAKTYKLESAEDTRRKFLNERVSERANIRAIEIEGIRVRRRTIRAEIKARELCRDVYNTERIQCIEEKAKELIAE